MAVKEYDVIYFTKFIALVQLVVHFLLLKCLYDEVYV